MQAVLRGWFAPWGLPVQVRVDNGAPWGGWSDLPPDLALWLLGLGVDIFWNRPRHRQGNAVIERAHGVCQRWVEPATCHSPAELQARLDAGTALQRARYPVPGGQSRLAAAPALAQGGRPYDRTQEADRWDEQRVWAWLASRVWRRRVDQVGRISLANRPLGVGRAWARTEVTIRLVIVDDAPVWTIHDAQGHLLHQHSAAELSRERILALAVSRRRVRPRRARGQPRAHSQV
ncbi:MAG TPA: hypothetical protein VFQ80_05900 [Thermomicrobiales bacterium]|nr:hypothetical protein [Thermomicrobiales bacterium]